MARVRVAVALSGGSLVLFLAATLSAGEQLPVPVPYAQLEPEQPYVPEAMDSSTRLFVGLSRRAAQHGDLVGAIELMQIAANTLVTRRNEDFELWDDLGELYCAQARREKDIKRASELRLNGKAMLAEFRCGERVMSGSR